MSKIELEKELVRLKDYDSTRNFVGISVELNKNGVCSHSGLVISFEGKLYYFHYYIKVILDDITDKIEDYPDIYFKELEIVSDYEVDTFLGHCEILFARGVTPLYGFVFDSSYYDSNGKFFLQNAKVDITTCVGFCIKVIRGWIYSHEEYLKLSDWDSTSLEKVPKETLEVLENYLTLFASNANISVDELYKTNEVKRIIPSELISSGFYTKLPIEKNSIDLIKLLVEEILLAKKAA